MFADVNGATYRCENGVSFTIYSDVYENIIEDLKKLHTYKFYIDEPTDTNESTVLGIYQKVKLDEDYQLKYLFESHGKKLHDKQEGAIEKKSVWVLKPKIAQFFISNFFEQFLLIFF